MHARIGNVSQGKKSASPQNTLTHKACIDVWNGKRCCLAGVIAPFALQQFADASTIDSNATAIPVGGSLCGKASKFHVRGFSFFWVLHSERGKPFAIDAIDHNPS